VKTLVLLVGWLFWADHWNSLDFVIVVAAILELVLELVGISTVRDSSGADGIMVAVTSSALPGERLVRVPIDPSGPSAAIGVVPQSPHHSLERVRGSLQDRRVRDLPLVPLRLYVQPSRPGAPPLVGPFFAPIFV
jgi:hypothetical protein